MRAWQQRQTPSCTTITLVSRLLLVLLLTASSVTSSVIPSVQEATPQEQGDTEPASLPYDALYVIGLKKCAERWRHVDTWASKRAVNITRVYATPFEEIDLAYPPIPVINISTHHTLRAGQVGCTMSHIRVWRDAFARNLSTIVVLEDDVHLTDTAWSRMSHILGNASAGSQQRAGAPWHYLYFRSFATVTSQVPLSLHKPWYGSLRYAQPSWGTAAYALSNAGIRYLLTRITTYSHPLDVQIERFQKGLDTQGADFVALDACSLDSAGSHVPGCPELTTEIEISQRGNCAYSASQAGNSKTGDEFPNLHISK